MSSTYSRIRSNYALDGKDYLSIKTIDMHTEGEPLRVIVDGYPELKGNTILEKRQFAKQNLDHLRTALMFEPRGHADMYGCILTEPEKPDSDFGIIFIHNEGYSTMCGHATIAITKLAVEMGWVQKVEPVTTIKIDAPCGQLVAHADISEGQVERCRFECVPSFVTALNEDVVIEGYGKIKYDIAYGGAFYAYVDVSEFSIDLEPSNTQLLIDLGMKIKKAASASASQFIKHPFEEDLSFLYGTIFIDAPVNPKHHSRNVCIFADGEVDRSPTGSGVSGRMALHFKKKEISLNETIPIESILGTSFTGKVLREQKFGDINAVITEIGGSAFITGQHNFLIDPNDPLKDGFLLK
ncbi:MAG: proline racemase family protein [Cyclobacteriaceae bacterium]